MPFPNSNYGTDESINLVGFRNIIGDISRPYLFMLEMPNIDSDYRKMTAFAASTSIPPYKLNVEEFEFQGAKRKIANGATFDSWDVEFITDQVYSLRSKFLAWMSQAYDPFQNSNASPHSYKFDGVKITQLSRTGTKVQTYQFIGLFPSQVGKIDLAHEKADYSKFTVTFEYDYFSVESGNLLEQGLQAATGQNTNTTLNITGLNGAPPTPGTPQNNIQGIFDVYGGQTLTSVPLI